MKLYLASACDTRLWKEKSVKLYSASTCRPFIYTHTHMNLYLAGKHPVKNGVIIKSWENLSILESYYYVRNNKFFNQLYFKGCDLLLDSGAFTFMASGKICDWDKYTEDYAAFISKYQIEKFFELDIDSIVGLKEVERLRLKLEHLTKRKCIPVWHKSRGVEYWKEMCREYDYVAIGGIVSKEIPRSILPRVANSLIKYAHENKTKVHLLGYTPCDILAEGVDCDSADSTTWIVGNRAGVVYKFNGLKICKYNVPKNKRLKSKEVARNNFLEWVKYQQYLKSK